MQINSYNNVTSKQRSTPNQNMQGMTSGSNSLSMQDFLSLLASQLANQDVMNPMDDTQFIAQMAQFTSLQTMQTMTEITYAQYGSSMVGKKVIVAKYDKSGNLTEDTGIVEKVALAGGTCVITVNGEDYDISSVMEIMDPNAPEKPTEKPENPDPKPEPEVPETGTGEKITV